MICWPSTRMFVMPSQRPEAPHVCGGVVGGGACTVVVTLPGSVTTAAVVPAVEVWVLPGDVGWVVAADDAGVEPLVSDPLPLVAKTMAPATTANATMAAAISSHRLLPLPPALA